MGGQISIGAHKDGEGRGEEERGGGRGAGGSTRAEDHPKSEAQT